MDSGTSDFVSASRWVAAFSVVIFHLYGISVFNQPSPGLLFQGLHFLCGFGHVGVIVFFVISGYLVGGRAILRPEDDRFHLIDYFVHRFARIYTVLIPGLIAGFVLDRVGIALFDGSGIYRHPDFFYSNEFGNNLSKHLSFLTLIGNVLSLQTITVSTFGSNAPLWSLANEWWYYVTFGFCMVAYRPGPMLTRVIAGGASLAVMLLLPPRISLWFVIWAVGAGVAVLDRYWTGWPFHVGATIALACLIAVRFANRQIHTELIDFTLDLAVALGYSAALLCAKNRKGPRRFWTLNRRLASFSYSVYLVHFPAMVFVAAVLKDVLGISFARPPSIATLLYIGALLVIIYGYASTFAVVTEAHTEAVRSRSRLVILGLGYRIRSFIHTFMHAPRVTSVMGNGLKAD